MLVTEMPDCETLKVPVLRVFDKDGFLTRIHGPRRGVEVEFTVRIEFIDAPEMEQPGGPEAKAFLERSIAPAISKYDVASTATFSAVRNFRNVETLVRFPDEGTVRP